MRQVYRHIWCGSRLRTLGVQTLVSTVFFLLNETGVLTSTPHFLQAPHLITTVLALGKPQDACWLEYVLPHTGVRTRPNLGLV
jgi:hypothetical protein